MEKLNAQSSYIEVSTYFMKTKCQASFTHQNKIQYINTLQNLVIHEVKINNTNKENLQVHFICSIPIIR